MGLRDLFQRPLAPPPDTPLSTLSPTDAPMLGTVPRTIGHQEMLTDNGAQINGPASLPGLIGAQQDKLAAMDNPGPHLGQPGSTHPGLLGKIGHVLAQAGNIAGDIVAPGTMALIPGTQLHGEMEHQAALRQLGVLNTEEQKQAMTSHEQVETAALPQQQADAHEMSTQSARHVGDEADALEMAPVPEPSLAAGYAHAVNEAIKSGRDPSADPIVQHIGDAITSIQKQPAAKVQSTKEQLQSQIDAASAKGDTAGVKALQKRLKDIDPMGEQRIGISLQGLGLREQQQAANTGINASDPATSAAVQAVANGSMKLQDVFGRGASTEQKAQFAAAVKAVNPSFNSGDHDIENRSRQFMISGQGGQTLTAANTLTHHLDLYDHAVDAMHNGDVKALNTIGNELGIQLGSDAPTNLALIRQGVAMEAARVYTGGVPGQAEIEQFNKSLSGDGSPAQMHGGARTVRGMMAGKLAGLQGQAEAGSQGRANFAPQGGISVKAPNGKTYQFSDQAGADKFKAAAGIK